jgi:hypothetical protein
MVRMQALGGSIIVGSLCPEEAFDWLYRNAIEQANPILLEWSSAPSITLLTSISPFRTLMTVMKDHSHWKCKYLSLIETMDYSKGAVETTKR